MAPQSDLPRGRLRLPGLLAACAALAGCASSGSRNAAELEAARADYEAGRYAEACTRASIVERRAPARDVAANAAYLAGLSAYRLGDYEGARRHLELAAASSVQPASGNAEAVLGLTLSAQGRHDDAAPRFAAAAGELQGDDSRRAAAAAAAANRRAGDDDSSRQSDEATPSTRTGAAAGSGGSFTLQVGAFREHDRAERAAADAAPVAHAHGLAPVRIEPSSDDRGGELYYVRFGRVHTRSAATAARGRLGDLGIIVAADR